MTFRYPSDQTGKLFSRPPFVDLAALQEHAERFEQAVEDLIDDVLASAGQSH
ncbi:MAG: hypothetical protein ABSG43_20750 [Solirubrobacteraceae bacterium]|jgi:hypothetical protein